MTLRNSPVQISIAIQGEILSLTETSCGCCKRLSKRALFVKLSYMCMHGEQVPSVKPGKIAVHHLKVFILHLYIHLHL